MIDSKAVKSTALTTLKQKWPFAIAVTFVPVIIILLNYLLVNLLLITVGVFAHIISALVAFFVISPLFLGSIRAFWRLVNNADEDFYSVFYYFENFKQYFSAIKFLFCYFLHLLKKTITVLILPVLFYVVSNGHVFEVFDLSVPLFVYHFRILAQVLFVVAGAFCIYKVLCVYLAPFLFVSCEDLTPKQCVTKAVGIAAYTKSMFFGCVWGYFLWIALSVFVIPLIFTGPFLMISYVISCRYSIAFYNRLGDKRNYNYYSI